jgi:hypothetical protein
MITLPLAVLCADMANNWNGDRAAIARVSRFFPCCRPSPVGHETIPGSANGFRPSSIAR